MPLNDVGIQAVLESGGDVITHIAVGEGQTAFLNSQTELVDEVDRKAVGSVSVNGTQLIVEVLFGNSEGNPLTGDKIYEWGFFNAAADGTMYGRGLWPAGVAKDSEQGWLVSFVEQLARVTS